MNDDERPISLSESIRRKVAESKAIQQEQLDKISQDDSFSSRYAIGKQISTDEFSTTYTCVWITMDRSVNLRLLKEEFVQNDEVKKQFRAEVVNQIKGLAPCPHGQPCDMGETENGAIFAVMDSKKVGVISNDAAQAQADQIREKLENDGGV